MIKIMKKLLLKQGVLIPIIYFSLIFISAFFADNYSHIEQHASELGINPINAVVKIFEVAAWLTSVMAMLLAIGMFVNFGSRLFISGTMIFIFGASLAFGAIFPIGSHWHGAYGIGLLVMALPFAFLYETKGFMETRTLKVISILVFLILFLWLWGGTTRLDPMEYRGLTQRVFGIALFGWLSYISFKLSKKAEDNALPIN